MAFIQPALGTTTANFLQRLRQLCRQGLAWPLMGIALLGGLIGSADLMEGLLRHFGDIDPLGDRQALQLLLAIALPVGAWEAFYHEAPQHLRRRQMAACALVIAVTLAGITQFGALSS